MNSQKSFAGLLVLFAACPVRAESWRVIYEQVLSNDAIVSYVDTESVRERNGIREAWILIDHSALQSLKDVRSGEFLKYRSVRQLSYFDCDRRQEAAVKAKFMSGRMGSGKIIHAPVYSATDKKLKWNRPEVWEYVEKHLKVVCVLDPLPSPNKTMEPTR